MAIIWNPRVRRPKSERRIPCGPGTSNRRLASVLDEIEWIEGRNGHGHMTGEAFHFRALQEAIERLRENPDQG